MDTDDLIFFHDALDETKIFARAVLLAAKGLTQEDEAGPMVELCDRLETELTALSERFEAIRPRLDLKPAPSKKAKVMHFERGEGVS